MSDDAEDHAREDPTETWDAFWRALGSAAALTPWASIAKALRGDHGTPPSTTEETLERLHTAARAWHRDWCAGLPAVDDLLAITQRMMELRQFGTPWLAAMATAPDSPWPRLGPLQEQQGQVEELLAAAADYRSALLRHGDQLAGLIEQCITDLRKALQDSPAASPPASPEDLLALWTEIASRRHDQALRNDDFGRGLAEVTNAWSRLRLAAQKLLDPGLESLGLPSRRQVMDTQVHLDRLRRRHGQDIRRLESRLERLEEALRTADDEKSRP